MTVNPWYPPKQDTLGPFTPDSVLQDYEKALQNIVHTVWPVITLRGCYFHYKQALWRKLAQSDLVPEYKVAGSDVKKSFHMIRALPYLPKGDVDMALGLPHEPHSSTSGPVTSRMLPSSDYPEPPTSQRDGTNGSKAWSAAPILTS